MTLLRGGIDDRCLCVIRVEAVSPYGVLPQARNEMRGLIDTGAEWSCITPEVFNALRLESDGFEEINAPGEIVKTYPTTTVDLVLHDGAKSSRTTTYTLPSHVIVATLVGQDFDVLIGVDVLSRGEFVANFPLGWWTFAAP